MLDKYEIYDYVLDLIDRHYFWESFLEEDQSENDEDRIYQRAKDYAEEVAREMLEASMEDVRKRVVHDLKIKPNLIRRGLATAENLSDYEKLVNNKDFETLVKRLDKDPENDEIREKLHELASDILKSDNPQFIGNMMKDAFHTIVGDLDLAGPDLVDMQIALNKSNVETDLGKRLKSQIVSLLDKINNKDSQALKVLEELTKTVKEQNLATSSVALAMKEEVEKLIKQGHEWDLVYPWSEYVLSNNPEALEKLKKKISSKSVTSGGGLSEDMLSQITDYVIMSFNKIKDSLGIKFFSELSEEAKANAISQARERLDLDYPASENAMNHFSNFEKSLGKDDKDFVTFHFYPTEETVEKVQPSKGFYDFLILEDRETRQPVSDEEASEKLGITMQELQKVKNEMEDIYEKTVSNETAEDVLIGDEGHYAYDADGNILDDEMATLITENLDKAD